MNEFLNRIESALASCSAERPIFHSEADFQFELASQLRAQPDPLSVRLEVPSSTFAQSVESKQAIDLVLTGPTGRCLVELKFAKAKVDTTWNAERFLFGSPPRDVARYGFLRDVQRLEQLESHAPGVAILLSNDPLLWTSTTRTNRDLEFHVHEGRELGGTMSWHPETSEEITKSKPPITFRGRYRAHWIRYVKEPCEFRYLLLPVARCSSCGQLLHAEHTVHADERTETRVRCQQRECPLGPAGLMSIRQLDAQGKTKSYTKTHDLETFEQTSFGESPQGEGNVGAVAKVFMAAANRDHGTNFTSWVEPPRDSRLEQGFDCELFSEDRSTRLRLQVTAAMPSEFHRERHRRKQARIESSTHAAANWILDAILKKSTSASPDIALVVDGVENPQLAFIADIVCGREFHKTLSEEAWHSIWVVGPSWIRKLAGLELPTDL